MTKKSFYNSIIRGSLVPLENWVKALMLIFSHVIYFPFFLLLQSYKFLMLIHNCRNKSYNTYFLTNNFFLIIIIRFTLCSVSLSNFFTIQKIYLEILLDWFKAVLYTEHCEVWGMTFLFYWSINLIHITIKCIINIQMWTR